MDTADLAHARDHVPELIERAARGEDVRIADPVHGTVRLPIVTMRPEGLTARDAHPHAISGCPDGKLVATRTHFR